MLRTQFIETEGNDTHTFDPRPTYSTELKLEPGKEKKKSLTHIRKEIQNCLFCLKMSFSRISAGYSISIMHRHGPSLPEVVTWSQWIWAIHQDSSLLTSFPA